ncbi:MAG TPA: phosphoglycerate kinase [Anaerolineales bacterium]|nr:phosphoglycerate kinase [Anaerolineales bacterium]
MDDKRTIRDLDVSGKRVLVRVDFNVPLEDGAVGDDTRIRAALPTIEYLIEHGAAVILCSHLGRPKGAPDPAYSLEPVARHLGSLTSARVKFVGALVGEEAEKAARALGAGEILVLENTRFHPGETANDPDLSVRLAALADVYVNDAFGSAHRAHASTEGVARHLPSAAGFLMEKEIAYLGKVIADPERPFVALLGGAKIGDKIGVIRNLIGKADHLLIGGGMANTFFKARGDAVADSLVEDEALETARSFLDNPKLHLPIDCVIADRFAEEAESRVVPAGDVPAGWRILDIGPETVKAYGAVIAQAKTIVWNGPMGVFEFPSFSGGTFGIARAVAESGAESVVGGGDSVAAINQAGLAGSVTHLSTGGGASLEMLEGKVLPGVAALNDK